MTVLALCHIRPFHIRPFCILLALALLTTLILPPVLALDSQIPGEARCRWTINDTFKMIVMSGIDLSPDASMVAYLVKRPS
jgi:hypothetical protein